jgi:ubiquinone/menaquinone biosynthesis C-methylase UbiE
LIRIHIFTQQLTPLQGETVVDLGCGGGFDVFLAARRVGPTGRAVGIDMNPAMLSLARANLAKAGTPPNIDFVESRITAVALPAGVADVVVSNCVVNLVPEGEKQAVFGEMFRLLRPGGRVAVSDVLARKTLPEGLLQSAAAHVACVGGASLVSEYATYLEKAGFIGESRGVRGWCVGALSPSHSNTLLMMPGHDRHCDP